jgi:hypothetical protein
VGRVLVFALTAALNPTMFAAVIAMLTLLNPQRLLRGYLIGTVVTSVTFGLVLVFVLPGSRSSGTARHSVNPALNIALGALLLLVVLIVATGCDQRRRAWNERRRERAMGKPPPLWRRRLSNGSARDTLVVGMMLSFPGASYIAGMNSLSRQQLGTVETVVAVLAFNAIMLMFVELPLLGFATRPQWTETTVRRFGDWLARSGGRLGLMAAAGLSLVLIGRGIVNW